MAASGVPRRLRGHEPPRSSVRSVSQTKRKLDAAYGLEWRRTETVPLRTKGAIVVHVPIPKCMCIPSVIDKHGTDEMLEDSLEVMSRPSVTAQAVVRIERREERATSALLAVFITVKQSWVIRPMRHVLAAPIWDWTMSSSQSSSDSQRSSVVLIL